ncbi:MAG: hypothetical protein M9894_19555 [Planctomycetes bacterium]|nr:hypothetical protein [Planctomycetota bacterium]
MADVHVRSLERADHAGDPDAVARLARARRRLGRCAWCDAPLPGVRACCCFACWAPARGGRCDGCPDDEEAPR